MKHEQDIEGKVDKAMTSLDGMQRAGSNPYLYTRIRARLQNDRSFWGSAIYFISRPAVAIAAICIVIVLNLAVFMQQETPQISQATNQDDVQVLASEYNISGNTIYDLTTDQQ
jgi:hypothetical protein